MTCSLPRLVAYQPAPAAAKLLQAGVVELLLEGVEVAKGALDSVGDGARRVAAGVGSHDLPEHGMIHVAAAVVAHRSADGLGHVLQTFQQIFGTHLLQLGSFLQRSVEVGYVGLMMLIVMQVHGLRIDVGFESRVIVGQRRNFMCHSVSSSSWR